jgi:predicted MPP superfamily phosphohydrolase
MKKLIFPIVLISILLIAEIGSYFAIRTFFLEQKSQLKWFNWIWFVSTILIYAFVFGSRMMHNNYAKNWMVNIFFLVLIAKLVIALAFLITIGIQFIKGIFASKAAASKVATDLGRRQFAAKLALGFAALPLGTMAYGLIKTAYDFKIHRPKIKFSNLPKAFHGLKIVQISDIHTGSLQGNHQLQKAFDLIKAEKPDVIFFTGDIVNNRTDEAFPYIPILSQLAAPLGVYSILGNHDYGDYEQWENAEAKAHNMKQMHDLHQKLGWKLLLNEHVELEKDGEKIGVLGIENWGANLNFKKYGKFTEAKKGSEHLPFKILLSHDPSHYNAEIKDQHTDIDLTLSGHTHGFQFGIEIPGFKWSPSQYIYPQWAGLYANGNQHLYVNRGLGCLGYMGRVGIRPEITVIELQSANV